MRDHHCDRFGKRRSASVSLSVKRNFLQLPQVFVTVIGRFGDERPANNAARFFCVSAALTRATFDPQLRHNI
jgi:hypothetical protein